MIHTYILHTHRAIKKKKILPFITLWTDLEAIMLTEISQKEKRQILYDPIYMWYLKQTKKRAHGYREQMSACQRQGVGRWGMDEMGDGGQKVQSSSYRISKSWAWWTIVLIVYCIFESC